MNPAKIGSCEALARHYHKDARKLSADLKERYAGLDLSSPYQTLLTYAIERTPEARQNKLDKTKRTAMRNEIVALQHRLYEMSRS